MTRTIENPVTGQRLAFLTLGRDTGGALFRAKGTFSPGGYAGVEHIHPHQDEHFEVVAGNAAFSVDGRETILGPGDTIDVPKGTKHTFWNAGEDEMQVIFEFEPAPPSTERFYELYFGFAQEGRVNAKAMPGLLDLALVWPTTSEHAVLASPPPWLQHAVMRALRPLARLSGRRVPECRATADDDRSAP